jgi:ribose 1,5-bisphosphokinase PhnN
LKRVVYIIGAPGAGKTTLMRETMAPYQTIQHAAPFAHIEYDHPTERVVQLGKDRGTFSGTDALSMSVQPNVMKWLQYCDYETIMAEGDRLANDKFFDACESTLDGLVLVLVDTDPEVAAARRKMRGSKQDPAWLKGRITKVEHLRKRGVITTLGRDLQREGALLRAVLGWGNDGEFT